MLHKCLKLLDDKSPFIMYCIHYPVRITHYSSIVVGYTPLISMNYNMCKAMDHDSLSNEMCLGLRVISIFMR